MIPTAVMGTFSDTLKKLMRERGVTAKVIHSATGIPLSTLSEWTGGRVPKLGEDAIRLAKFFGVSLEYLVTGQEEEKDIIEDILKDADEGFMTLHSGIYRIKVEKHTDSKKKKE